MNFYCSAFNTHFKSTVSPEQGSFPTHWLLRYFITHHTLVFLEATVLTVSVHDVVPRGDDRMVEGSKWLMPKIEMKICCYSTVSFDSNVMAVFQ